MGDLDTKRFVLEASVSMQKVGHLYGDMVRRLNTLQGILETERTRCENYKREANNNAAKAKLYLSERRLLAKSAWQAALTLQRKHRVRPSFVEWWKGMEGEAFSPIRIRKEGR
jgi:hypothetical protein